MATADELSVRPSARPIKSHGYRKASAAGEGWNQELAETAADLVMFPITTGMTRRIWFQCGQTTTTRGLYDVIAAASGLFRFFVFLFFKQGDELPFHCLLVASYN